MGPVQGGSIDARCSPAELSAELAAELAAECEAALSAYSSAEVAMLRGASWFRLSSSAIVLMALGCETTIPLPLPPSGDEGEGEGEGCLLYTSRCV